MGLALIKIKHSIGVLGSAAMLVVTSMVFFANVALSFYEERFLGNAMPESGSIVLVDNFDEIERIFIDNTLIADGWIDVFHIFLSAKGSDYRVYSEDSKLVDRRIRWARGISTDDETIDYLLCLLDEAETYCSQVYYQLTRPGWYYLRFDNVSTESVTRQWGFWVRVQTGMSSRIEKVKANTEYRESLRFAGIDPDDVDSLEAAYRAFIFASACLEVGVAGVDSSLIAAVQEESLLLEKRIGDKSISENTWREVSDEMQQYTALFPLANWHQKYESCQNASILFIPYFTKRTFDKPF